MVLYGVLRHLSGSCGSLLGLATPYGGLVAAYYRGLSAPNARLAVPNEGLAAPYEGLAAPYGVLWCLTGVIGLPNPSKRKLQNGDLHFLRIHKGFIRDNEATIK